jgi:hypothetical protein
MTRRPSLLGGHSKDDAQHRRSSIADDAAQLAALGHQQELKRNFSFVSMLGLAFAILVCAPGRAVCVSFRGPPFGVIHLWRGVVRGFSLSWNGLG